MCARRPLRFHLRRRKFSTIWPGIRTHKTPSTVSFTGGCSTPALESGPRELQRPSRNSSNEVFSNKANLRTATYFTAPPRTISRRFSNGHHEPLLLMTMSDEIHALQDLQFIVTGFCGAPPFLTTPPSSLPLLPKQHQLI